MTNTFRVAVVQMTSNDEVDRNLDIAERLVRSAAREGARVAVLPECFAYLGRDREKLTVAEPLPQGGPILTRVAGWARELDIELVLGGFWERADAERAHNSCVHLDASGNVRAVYRKIHLFDVDLADGTKLEESASVAPGENAVVTETVFGPLGLSVCYDVRFPALYRALVDSGAIAIAVPAAFTLHTGKDHWHVLLRARAIETQCYVLAAAQTGRHVMSSGHDNRVSYGHALIADPWGTVIAQCSEGEGVAIASIDPSYVEQVRRQLPALRHRRPFSTPPSSSSSSSSFSE